MVCPGLRRVCSCLDSPSVSTNDRTNNQVNIVPSRFWLNLEFGNYLKVWPTIRTNYSRSFRRLGLRAKVMASFGQPNKSMPLEDFIIYLFFSCNSGVFKRRRTTTIFFRGTLCFSCFSLQEPKSDISDRLTTGRELE